MHTLGLKGTQGPPDASFLVLPMRSNPKPYQHRKDRLQRESLDTDMLYDTIRLIYLRERKS